MLWARTHDRPIAQAPTCRNRCSSGIVSGIVIEQEQIGPTRYIARLGVLFDRARTGQMLGVQGLARRSAPMLVIPVMRTGSAAYSFEYRNEWQRAWAQFRTASSPIDYVRPTGLGHRSAAAQPRPDQAAAAAAGGGCCSTNMARPTSSSPEVELRRAYPGGPAIGIFTARYGPDNRFLGRFGLRVAKQRRDPAHARRRRAPARPALRPGARPRPAPARSDASSSSRRRCRRCPRRRWRIRCSRRGRAAGPDRRRVASFSIQVATPDAGAVQQAEVSVSRVDGVTSAITTSLALGGTSIMRVQLRRRRRRARRPRSRRRAGGSRWSAATR